ncbi:fibronectin type III domain-containing protein [Actinoplanes subglobosus]|uniref:Fibronectin type III domain-containing protein n=1 Tax=Actinoplanes subglobosus TaxID=1547892 RepID=A0ABV8J402_9ACTN
MAVRAAGAAVALPQLELAGNAGLTAVATSSVVVAPGDGGALTVTNSSTAAVTVDAYISGFYARPTASDPGLNITPIPSVRVLDDTSITAFASATATLAGRQGVPADAAGGCLSVNTEPSQGTGSLVAYPAGTNRPGAVSASYGTTRRTNTVVHTSAGTGGIAITNIGISPVRATADLTCYFSKQRRPEPPQDVTAAAGDRSAVVYWRPGTSDAPVTGYTVTTSPGGRTVTVPGSATSARVDGLTNATVYAFTVTARSAIGTSDPSAPASAEPAPPPTLGAPFVTFVYPRDGAARVAWSPPAEGIAGVVGYRITAQPGGTTTTVSGTATETIITGLTNGTTYTVTVTALNGNGPGEASPPSEPVTPRAADVPLPPAGLLTVALAEAADVQWVAPADGGAPITGYTVTAEPGGHRLTVAAGTTVARITGLINGTTYAVRVTATNKAGTGSPAEATGVQPAAARVPAAPVDLRAGAAATGAVEVRWNAPVDPGTSSITGYTVTASPGGLTTTVTNTSARITGLDPDTSYTFTVSAANSAGTGPATSTPSAVRPQLSLKAAPRLITSDEAATLTRLSGTTLVFANPPASITALTSGTIVIVPVTAVSPRGLLGTVTSVSGTGGIVSVTTRETPLTDIFDQADLSAATEIGDQDIIDVVAESPAIRLRQPTIKGKTLSQGAKAAALGTDIGIRDGHLIAEIGLSLNTEQGQDPLNNADRMPPVGGRLEANLDFAPHLDNSITVSGGDVSTHHLNRIAFKAELRAKVGAMITGERELPGLRLRARCFNIQAGPVPIVVCLELNVRPRFTIDGSVGLTAALSFGRIVGAEMATRNGAVTDLHGINDAFTPARHDLDAYGDSNATIAVPVEANVYFYNTAGPGLIVRPYLQLKVDTTQDPWWEVRLGVTLGVFLRSREFFGHSFDFSREDLANFFVTVAKADGAFFGLKLDPEDADVLPGQPVTFTATGAQLPSTPAVDWRLVSGPGVVGADGTFVSPLAGTAVIEAYSAPTDWHRELRARAVVNITGSTRPGPPQQPHAAPRPLAAQVSWQAPITDGRSPIVRYAVVPLPDGPVTYVPGAQTTATVAGLAADTPYRFQVYAINAIGQSGASVATDAVSPVAGVRPTGDVFNIATDADGVANTRHIYNTTLSGDGRYVFFDLDTNDAIAPREVYDGPGGDPESPIGGGRVLVRKDRVTGEIIVVSRDTDGHTPIRIDGTTTDASYDGNRILFVTDSWVDGEPHSRVLLHDIAAGRTVVYSDDTIDDVQNLFLVRNGAGAIVHGHDTASGSSAEQQVFIIDAPGATPRAMPCPPEFCDLVTGPAESDDVHADQNGTAVLYTLRYKDDVLRYDVVDGSTTNLTQKYESPWEESTLSDPVISRTGEFIAAEYSYWDGFTAPYNWYGLVRAPGATGPIQMSDVIKPFDEGIWVRPFSISEDGRIIGYTTTISLLSDPNWGYERVVLYDTATGEEYELAAGQYLAVSDMELADNPTVVVWQQEGSDAIMARELGGA